jgi:hypothetical protein
MPPKKAAVISFPVFFVRSTFPPGCSSINVKASWMKPEMRISVRVFDSSWTVKNVPPKRKRHPHGKTYTYPNK